MAQSGRPPKLAREEATIGEVVVSAASIRRRVRQLGRQIAQQYQGRPLMILAVMTGSVVFLADLIRCLPIHLRLCLVACSSYGGKTICSRGVKSVGPLPGELAGKDVLILDDILDTGRTLAALIEQVGQLKPQSVKTCVLLKKVRPEKPAKARSVDFLGFEIEDTFVVGYGLDYDNLYRNMPDICRLRFMRGK